MKLQAQVGDELHSFELERERNRVFARIYDREYEFEASEVEPDVFLLKHNRSVSEVFITRAGDSYTASVNGKAIEVRLIDPKRLRNFGSGSGDTEGVAEIKTMMPGKVVRFVANPGQDVEKGDGVIVVEAMKMQNELKSPKAGTLKEFRVSEGDTVSAGDVLALVE